MGDRLWEQLVYESAEVRPVLGELSLRDRRVPKDQTKRVCSILNEKYTDMLGADRNKHANTWPLPNVPTVISYPCLRDGAFDHW